QSAEIDRWHARGWGRQRGAEVREARRQTDLLEDVGRAERRLLSLLNELVAAIRGPARDGPRHREDRAALLETGVRRDDRARLGRAFDHDDSARESRDQTIAARKRAGVRPLARWMLGDETALREHPVIQRRTRTRIDKPESVAEDADRATTGVERRRVRDRIDAPRHAADDDRTLSHRAREDP